MNGRLLWLRANSLMPRRCSVTIRTYAFDTNYTNQHEFFGFIREIRAIRVEKFSNCVSSNHNVKSISP